jgi:predicted RNA-binding protein with PIN domain
MDVPDDLLRPGLEVAFIVAVVGARQRPPIPPPSALRPFLQFQKLPSAALVPVRKVVEDDVEFRRRVAAVATDETVNRASWLWLHRSEGWEDELAALVEQEPEPAADQRSARALQRRVDAAEAKARRQAAELATLRAEVERAQSARERAAAEASKAVARAEELERAAARARQRTERAAEELDAARQAATDAARQLEQARAENEELRARSAAGAGAGAGQPTVGEAPVARPDGDGTAAGEDRGVTAPRETVGHSRSLSPPAAAPPPEVPPVAPAAWPAAALDALGGAAAAAASLAASLQELAGSFVPVEGGGPPVEPPPPAATRAVARPAEPPGARGPRRRALRIPRGMHVGTAEADAWLLTEAEAAVVVDGYNVAKLGWPDAVLADQRERLLDVLDDLATRYSTTVEVVFDGADVGPVRSARRRRVAVRFSPPQVLADDVIRELVASYPPTDPIVVVTNDRAVAHDVRAAGANVVSSDGLLAVARR